MDSKKMLMGKISIYSRWFLKKEIKEEIRGKRDERKNVDLTA